MPKLVHPELSYQVRGGLFDVYNALGPMLKEEYCWRISMTPDWQ